MDFDPKPVIKGSHSKIFVIAFLSGIVITCLYGTLDGPAKNRIFFIFSAIFFSSFIVGELSGSFATKKIANIINGNRDQKKEYIKGSYKNSDVEFFIGNQTFPVSNLEKSGDSLVPSIVPSINYSIIVDTKRALSQKKTLRRDIDCNLDIARIHGYQMRITDTSVILFKRFWTASQLKADEAETIYSILYQTCNQFLPEYSKEKTPDSPKNKYRENY